MTCRRRRANELRLHAPIDLATSPRGLCLHAVLIVALLSADVGTAVAGAQTDDFVGVTDAMLQNPSDDDWLMWRRTLDGWAYSPLDEITRENVKDLRLVWSRGMSEGRQQGTPLVYDGVMYMPNPADVIQAIDAVTGDLIWEYRREVHEDVSRRGTSALTANNRNLAIYGELIIDTSGDGFVFALDATTGELVWETLILDYETHPTMQSSGPIIANGKVISGRSCLPKGGPDSCIIAAHDANTGAELWRRRTIPGPGEPGDETWGDIPFEDRKHVGTWMVPSYDPDLDLIYIGTSVTSPAPKFLLGSADRKHLYHNSTLALRGETGEIAWYYQHLNDHWDLDHPFERLLVDTAVAPNADEVKWINPRVQPGEMRKVVTGVPGKTGVVYTLDRETGEFLWATPTVFQNVIISIDGATGEVTENPEVVFQELEQKALVCPTFIGGKDWQAGAYSPLTNAMYLPMRNACAVMTATRGGRLPIYALDAEHQITPGTDLSGVVHAVSAETGEALWTYEQRASTQSLFVTGGGLVFVGDGNGRFRALDQDTGEILWEINLGSPVTGFPIAFGLDGRQYVVASTGNTSAALSIGLTPELRPSSGNNLFVFALPDRQR
ncbi:MAG: PQQ-binding-like beta-propeller repeat protein [Acidobacteriota bacterium]|nr:PQQ-binding-like beta-propeller repeat protein [Acidobacteriota bacterium]